MAAFGVSSQAVRQAVSRMTRQGWLVARRDGNRAFYMVTARGRRRIEELSPRIYGPVIEWDGRWRLLSLCRRGGAAPRARASSEGACRAWLGATLVLDLDLAVGCARSRSRGGRSNRSPRCDRPLRGRVPRPAQRPRTARALLERRLNRVRLSGVHLPLPATFRC